jgi:hypothetical protein
MTSAGSAAPHQTLKQASVAVWRDLLRLGATGQDESSPEQGTQYAFYLLATPRIDSKVTITVRVTARLGASVAKVSVEVPTVELSEAECSYFGDIVRVACDAAERAKATLDAALKPDLDAS